MHLKLINNPLCYLTDHIIIREVQLKSCHTLIKKCSFNFFEQCSNINNWHGKRHSKHYINCFFYLSQPVVVTQFEQAREKAFTLSGPHELLPLPHILLEQILLPQLRLPLRFWPRVLAFWYQGTFKKENINVTSFHYFISKINYIILQQWYRMLFCLDTVLTSCWEAFFPGLIRCFGVFLEPELGLGMDFITVGPDCGQGLSSSILWRKANTLLCKGTWNNQES